MQCVNSSEVMSLYVNPSIVMNLFEENLGKYDDVISKDDAINELHNVLRGVKCGFLLSNNNAKIVKEEIYG